WRSPTSPAAYSGPQAGRGEGRARFSIIRDSPEGAIAPDRRPVKTCDRPPGRVGRMEYFIQQLINGLTLGSIYGLIAIGYTMVYGIIGMINFAHGDVFMVGAFQALIMFLILFAIGVSAVPLALFIVLVVSMALTALYGWTVERIAYRPLRHSFRLAPLISAIGMSVILTNFVQAAHGARG